MKYNIGLEEKFESRRKNEDIVIGSVSCSYYEDLQQIEITYFIGSQYRNKGYALEAVKAYTEYFFNNYNKPKIIATVREENIPAWKVVEKAGFKFKEKKIHKDLNDEKLEMYYFYEFTKHLTNDVFSKYK
ncbi:GNAT family N-acetyltransferase [Clostridium chauvoei]|uniref:GNAT family N-acetyltransferase n=2 Tax=Clostridium chauvoei TaxID=46867 RepID=A0ABD4RKW1_9CLOT|nr:GNAT family N-acetyltransferase [Clostridium chauvoei]MBX7284372.1 GNAT family N-acetyltransferase [Clostridium chauvoei]MBX7286895.1 GNAT family N-acetyltransferase [Clostridium chauvoei]MBX7289417.1 GNAT family N-acetyltransferase [Clostridium chauvoei]MBX7291935.1 GNAT family N-acetyltransferase [Clostridium chauvoei]